MGAFAHTLESLSPPTAEATKRGFMKHKQTWKSKSKIVKFLAQGGGGGTKKQISQNNFINKFLSSSHLGYNTPAPTPNVGSTSAAASSQSRTETVNEEAIASIEK